VWASRAGKTRIRAATTLIQQGPNKTKEYGDRERGLKPDLGTVSAIKGKLLRYMSGYTDSGVRLSVQ
jgi:hypothetical protein